MTNEELEIFYREHLEEDIIVHLSKKKNISLEKAMETYYQSNLANLIHDGEYGIQYLDYTLLTEILEKDCHD